MRTRDRELFRPSMTVIVTQFIVILMVHDVQDFCFGRAFIKIGIQIPVG